MLDVNYIEGNTAHLLRQLAKAAGVTMQDVIHNEMRLSAIQAIKLTAPSGATNAQGLAKAVKPSARKAKEQGYKRVEKDIRKIFKPLDGQSDIMRGWDIPGGKAIKLRSGAVVAGDTDSFPGNISHMEMARRHKRNRRNDGRVTEGRGGSESGRNTLNIGRWKWVEHTYLKAARIDSYIALRQKRVGNMKSGWMPGLEKFAGLTNKKPSAPAWVKNQKKRGHVEGVVTASGNGSVAIVNDVPYFRGEKIDAVIGVVHSIAQKRLNRFTEKRVKDLVKQFNTGRTVRKVAA